MPNIAAARVAHRAPTFALGIALALAAAAASPTRAAAEAAPTEGWQFGAHSVRHSDALSLAAIDREAWDELEPRPGRNLTYLDEEVRLTWRAGTRTSLALLARQYATLVASADALQLVAQARRRQPPAGDRAYAVQAEMSGFSGAGLAVAHDAALAPGWHGRAEVQGLVLGRWVERRVDGSVNYRAADARYAFDLGSFELDNRLEFPFQEPFARRGAALLLAASLEWRGERAWLRAALRDGGWLHWRGVPQQHATLSTATLTVDDDGFIVYLPLVQGQNSQQGRTQWRPWRGELAAGWRLGRGHEAGLRVETLPGFGALPGLGWQWSPGEPAAGALGAEWPAALGAEWRVHERRLDLRARWGGFAVEAGADRLGSDARSRRFALGWRGAF